MEKSIPPILAKIFSELNENTSSHPSLLGGQAGHVLYNLAYLNFTGHRDGIDVFQEKLQTIAENSIAPRIDPFFCNGRSGINWLFSYLNKKNILDEEDLHLLCYGDDELAAIAISMLKKDNYDFLHGAIGIARYLLYAIKKPDRFYKEFFHELRSLSHKSAPGGYIPDYDLKNRRSLADQTNLGLAHGLPGILKLCIDCYNHDVCINEAWSIANEIIAYLLNHTNKNTSNNYFPTVISSTGRQNEYSRLAWCYGDLGIAYILYQAAETFCDTQLKLFSKDILLHNTKRQEVEQTGIRDAGFCHGSAGVAHIYNKMWHYTNEPVFKASCEFWLQKTIEFFNQEPASSTYKKYLASENKYENCYGLLEGSAGIGLVLLSYLTADFSWDYCVMLNN
jgi:lantibiotic biosynthesis protein